MTSLAGRLRQSLGGARRAVAVSVLLAAGPAWAAPLGHGEGDDISLWRVAGALILCLLLACAAALAIKTRIDGRMPSLDQFFQRGSPDRRLHLVESLRIGHQVDLHIVAFDGREMLIASGPHGVQLLDPPRVDPIASEAARA